MRVNIDKTLSKTEFLKVGVPQETLQGKGIPRQN